MGLAFVAIIAIALSVLAIFSQRPPEDAAAPVPPPPVFTAPPVEQTEPTTPPALDIPQVSVTPQRLMVAGVEPGHLLRATLGACGAESTLEVSTDGGIGWMTASLGGIPSAAIRQLDAQSAMTSQLVFLDEDCAPQLARSWVGGTSWEEGGNATGLWYLASDTSKTARVSGEDIELPCTAVAISGAGSFGAVLCDSSTVSVSVDSGVNWAEPVDVPNAVAVTATDESVVVASYGEADCSGIRTRALDGALLNEPSSCFEIESDANQVAIARQGDAQYLWVGNSFSRSTDRGGSWS